MDSHEVRTPVAIFAYNRPDAVRRVMEVVARVQPRRLLLVQDGPRAGRPGEEARVAEARHAMESAITWGCDVVTNYAPANLGCRRRVASGLDWVFEQAEEAIILEDDCVPDTSAFRFFDELLDRFRADPWVMSVAGSNVRGGPDPAPGGADYSFSSFPFVWGWASWRRAWRLYDAGLRTWSGREDDVTLRALFPARADRRFWARLLDRVASGELDTWDIAWTWSCWRAGGLACVPTRNLVTNIGFGDGATHTFDPAAAIAALPTQPMAYPLRHPARRVRDVAVDEALQHTVFRPTLRTRLGRRLRRA